MKNKSKHFILAIGIPIFLTLLTCCKTCPKEEINLEWTTFPNPVGNVVLVENEVVQMPLWYWIKITEYVADTETNIKIYESLNCQKPP